MASGDILLNDPIAIMAKDLGIIRYPNETNRSYYSRILYSGMACWIKASALDQSPYGKANNQNSVSRRHINDKASKVLGSFLTIYPELEDWFYIEDNTLNPINTIRNRLIRHGDLLNNGFNTDLSLANSEIINVYNCFDSLIGEGLSEDFFYSGVSMIRNNNDKHIVISLDQRDSVERVKEYLNNAWWESEISHLDELYYFNPYGKSINNYSLWQKEIVDEVDGIILSRRSINEKGFEYYILKPSVNRFHRIDPFFAEMGEHIRFMIVLRKLANNPVVGNVIEMNDHLIISTNVRIPNEELSVFEYYAWPIQRIDDYRNWVIRKEVWSYLNCCLNNLGMEMR